MLGAAGENASCSYIQDLLQSACLTRYSRRISLTLKLDMENFRKIVENFGLVKYSCGQYNLLIDDQQVALCGDRLFFFCLLSCDYVIQAETKPSTMFMNTKYCCFAPNLQIVHF